jgi:leader peptidase (prepilin peptidase)/N-methyltransferase
MTFFPEPLASVFVFAFGLILGSFLNVCIYRLPRGKSIVRPGSRCTACGVSIRWYQNIPLLSWVALRGRCAACSALISWRYPFVEALSASILLALWHYYGPGPAFAVASVFALAMVVLFFTDLDLQLLPDKVTLTGLGLGLAVSWFNPFLDGTGWMRAGFSDGPGWGRVWASLAGAALGAGLLWGFGALYGKLRGVEAMGLGDVKMMAMVGAFAGPFGVLLTIFAGSLVGALVGVALIPLRGRSLQDTLPFGCFLAPAALIALLAGQWVAAAYRGMLFPGI